MTIRQKLKEKSWILFDRYVFSKMINGHWCHIALNGNTKIRDCWLEAGSIDSQEEIDNLQIAFNILQAERKELEESIKEIENDKRKV